MSGRRVGRALSAKWTAWVLVLAALILLVWGVAKFCSNRPTRAQPFLGEGFATNGSVPQDSRTGRYSGVINLYWIHDSDNFSYINYKSLESVLCAYPGASVRVRIVGPEHAAYYKVGRIVSKQTFHKYSKQGFNLQVNVQHAALNSGVRSQLPGYTFWTSAMRQRFSSQHIRDMQDVVHAPFFLSFYDRVVSLYLQGGLSTDFDWMHLREVPGISDTAGLVLKVLCDSTTSCTVSTIMHAPARHPWLHCLLAHFNHTDGIPKCLETGHKHGGIQCIKKAADDCFSSTGTTNMLFEASLESPGCEGEVQVHCAPVDLKSERLLWDDPLNSEVSLDAFQWSIRVPMLWLGRPATLGSWNPPSPRSPLGELVAHNDKLVKQFIDRKLESTASTSPVPIHCSAYHPYPGSPPAAERQGNMSCALSFVLPGFMKAGSSYIYETLMGHPMLVRALRGTQFKETGCYLPQRMQPNRRHSRVQCFPFVQPHDRVMFGDATVYYSQAPQAAEQLLRDNPSLKVIFALRHPVSRAESHHHFDYYAFKQQGVPNMNDCVAKALDPNAPLVKWREAAVSALRHHRQHGGVLHEEGNPGLRALLHLHQQGLKKKTTFMYFRCSNLILHSLYFLPIFRWAQIIPRKNLRVVHVEMMDPRVLSMQRKVALLSQLPALDNATFDGVWPEHAHRSRNTSAPIKTAKMTELDKKYLVHQFNALHRFIGLPDRKRMWPGGGHETPVKMPDAMSLNDTFRRELHVFFEPFNQLLSEFVKELQKAD